MRNQSNSALIDLFQINCITSNRLTQPSSFSFTALNYSIYSSVVMSFYFIELIQLQFLLEDTDQNFSSLSCLDSSHPSAKDILQEF